MLAPEADGTLRAVPFGCAVSRRRGRTESRTQGAAVRSAGAAAVMTSSQRRAPDGAMPCLCYKVTIFRKDARKVKGWRQAGRARGLAGPPWPAGQSSGSRCARKDSRLPSPAARQLR